MHFELIALDADDTLWHTESYYREVEGQYLDLLAGYGLERQAALAQFHQIEIANLPDFGYGIKGFVLSLVQAAVTLTGGRVRAADVQAIIELGRGMLRHEITLFPGVAQAVARLAQSHTLALVTKGDLMDQERKIASSGLEKHFQYIEIISDKTPETYAALLARLKIDPAGFFMVGNSMRSDILPVLALGGWAAHVPYSATWAHEAAGEVGQEQAGRFFELVALGELPGLIEELEKR
jgi:putative hydrolase of the HAD superfamily